MSLTTRYAKAQRLAAQHGIVELTDIRVFRLAGDNWTYTVTVSPTAVSSCTCKSTVDECSHILAVWMWIKASTTSINL